MRSANILDVEVMSRAPLKLRLDQEYTTPGNRLLKRVRLQQVRAEGTITGQVALCETLSFLRLMSLVYVMDVAALRHSARREGSVGPQPSQVQSQRILLP